MIQIEKGRIPGLLTVHPTVHADDRGIFVKTFHEDWFAAAGIPTVWPERFYSRSHRGVIRGLHFQRPPADHEKLVYCASGEALDVVVDLRTGSPTYGEFEVIHLDDESWDMVFVPKGLAHGFATIRDGTVMAYATSTVHDPARDSGIRWDSVAAPWPFDDPVISERDAALPILSEFVSPFSYEV